ncbi:MAG: hypothetical protein HQM15_00230 [Deltaproteobacteria bacterium]|nr:hypothetical protein [Deltaproteobacteria bacterium]
MQNYRFYGDKWAMQRQEPLNLIKNRFLEAGYNLSDREIVLRFLSQVQKKSGPSEGDLVQQIKSKVDVIQNFSQRLSKALSHRA